HLLRNRIYIGKIVHKGKVHEGAHAAIVDVALFERVQAKLDAQTRRHRAAADRRTARAPLTSKLFDAAGEPMSPTTSRGKSGRSYGYYVSAPLQQGKGRANDGHVQRIAAPAIERVIAEAAQCWMPRLDDPFASIRSVHVSERGLQIALKAKRPADVIARLRDDQTLLDRSADTLTILLPIRFVTRGAKHTIFSSGTPPPQPDPVLIAALRKAHAMLRTERGLPVIDTAPSSPYDRNILRLAFLAPDIQRAILAGRQPFALNLEALKKTTIALSWSKQREALGFGDQAAP
ncbi:MAG: recombinase family protein, partial [Erythrobacter sp.]|nr:recombinase family protein [Erythrobacter sp.]